MDKQRYEQIVNLGREPISAESPVGDPVRYDELFEQLQAQMDRIGSLTGEEVDWAEVTNLATEILQNKSKDLLVMAYLCLGLFHHEGYGGLAAGLEGLSELLKNFWDGCYPKVKPPHGRYNALQYVAEKLMPLVELKAGKAARHPRADEKEDVHRCADALAALDEAITQCFADQPETPNMLPLLRALKALRTQVGPLENATADTPQTPPSAATQPAAVEARPAGQPSPTPGPEQPGVPDTFATATQAVQSVLKIARYLLGQDNKDARAYRLMRAVQFGGLTAVPKSGLIPPPQAARRQYLENLLGAGDWPRLLADAEAQFATTPLWLDLQRYVAQAAAGLGPAYAPVRDAVTLDIVALSHRLPEIFDLTFKDGSPAADGATRAWLDEIAAKFGGGAGTQAAPDEDSLAAAVDEARKLLAEAKGDQALRRLSQELDASGHGRKRFRASLALARFCLDMNKLTAAVSILEGLEQSIEQHHLDRWEPELAAQALGLLYTALRRSRPKPGPADADRAAGVFARLCRLDPSQAIKLETADAGAKK